MVRLGVVFCEKHLFSPAESLFAWPRVCKYLRVTFSGELLNLHNSLSGLFIIWSTEQRRQCGIFCNSFPLGDLVPVSEEGLLLNADNCVTCTVHGVAVPSALALVLASVAVFVSMQEKERRRNSRCLMVAC